MVEGFNVGGIVRLRVLGIEATIDSIISEPNSPVMVGYSFVDKNGDLQSHICDIHQFISAIEPVRRKPITFTL